jgi:6-phosphogluconolactonase (cycloisomerase 2 family)
MSRVLAYVGAYTDRGKGIHIFDVDPTTGGLTPVAEVAVASPSSLAFGAGGRVLYACSVMGAEDGTVSAFAVDRGSGGLRLINRVGSGGKGPCHLSVAGGHVLVANYDGNVPSTSAGVAVLPIGADGALGEASDVKLLPRGPLGPRRAPGGPPGSFADSGHDAPHAHQAIADPSGRFALVSDLGTDRIHVWRLEGGRLLPHEPAFFQAAPGAGPRHVAFHPNGRFAYSLHEESSTLDFLEWDADAGRFAHRQTISTLPAGYAGTNFPSEIEVSADGRHVYAANRLCDSIATVALAADGTMALRAVTWTRGSYPRHFASEPDGRFMYVLHTRSDNITIFRTSHADGALHFTEQWVPVGNPSQIVFLTL